MKQTKIFIRKTDSGYIARTSIYGKSEETMPYKKRVLAILAMESKINELTNNKFNFKI